MRYEWTWWYIQGEMHAHFYLTSLVFRDWYTFFFNLGSGTMHTSYIHPPPQKKKNALYVLLCMSSLYPIVLVWWWYTILCIADPVLCTASNHQHSSLFTTNNTQHKWLYTSTIFYHSSLTCYTFILLHSIIHMSICGTCYLTKKQILTIQFWVWWCTEKFISSGHPEKHNQDTLANIIRTSWPNIIRTPSSYIIRTPWPT